VKDYGRRDFTSKDGLPMVPEGDQQQGQSRPDKNPMTANTPPVATVNPTTAKMARAKTSTRETSYKMNAHIPTDVARPNSQ
jgi:hypothetical protein